jgi:multidrug transporter EmrE-like cation transporter
MPPTAIALVLLAALMHALWNLLLKGKNRMRTAWLASAVGGLLGLPFILLSDPAPIRSWGFAAVAALLEVVYLTLLSAAYARGDFSAVYPLARGSAPALLALWAALLLGERPSPAGMMGLALLLGGWSSSGGSAPRGQAATGVTAGGAGAGVALCISAIPSDAAGVRSHGGCPYTAGRFLLTAVAMTP